MLIFPMRNGSVGGLNQCDGPTRVVLCCSGIYVLQLILTCNLVSTIMACILM